MAMMTQTPAAPFGAEAIHRAVTFVESGLETLRIWRAARATEKSLNMLSNRELEDIGLTRGEIQAVARNLAQNAF